MVQPSTNNKILLEMVTLSHPRRFPQSSMKCSTKTPSAIAGSQSHFHSSPRISSLAVSHAVLRSCSLLQQAHGFSLHPTCSSPIGMVISFRRETSSSGLFSMYRVRGAEVARCIPILLSKVQKEETLANPVFRQPTLTLMKTS